MARQGAFLVALALVMGMALPAGGADDFDMVFPHDGVLYEMSNDFGVFVREHVHMGIDIFSPKGTAVVAVADGFVVKMRRGETAGYYLEIRHADGYSSLYLHLNNDQFGTDNGRGGWSAAFASDLEVGDFVRAGDLIGYVGDSGNAEGTRPHTHFELHRYGRAIDPYPYAVQALEAYEVRKAIEAGETVYR